MGKFKPNPSILAESKGKIPPPPPLQIKVPHIPIQIGLIYYISSNNISSLNSIKGPYSVSRKSPHPSGKSKRRRKSGIYAKTKSAPQGVYSSADDLAV